MVIRLLVVSYLVSRSGWECSEESSWVCVYRRVSKLSIASFYARFRRSPQCDSVTVDSDFGVTSDATLCTDSTLCPFTYVPMPQIM